ncbi:MAG: ribosome-associated translation inhibitor RaiA [Spirochaetota bacterium]
MNIKIKGRHFDVSEELSEYTLKKFSRLEKYFHKLIDTEIIMSMEKHNHVIEAVINGDGMKFFGTEKASDMYSAIDMLIKNMEKQVVKHKEKHSAHKAQPLKNNVQAESPQNQIEVIYNLAANRPKDEVEAFLEMRVDNRDFILFNKNLKDNINSYNVLYKTGNGFKMAELPKKIKKEEKIEAEHLMEFDFIVRKDSSTNPEIELKKCKSKTIKCMEINNAIKEISESAVNFVPFFNSETNVFNIIYKNKDAIEVIIPPA